MLNNLFTNFYFILLFSYSYSRSIAHTLILSLITSAFLFLLVRLFSISGSTEWECIYLLSSVQLSASRTQLSRRIVLHFYTLEKQAFSMDHFKMSLQSADAFVFLLSFLCFIWFCSFWKMKWNGRQFFLLSCSASLLFFLLLFFLLSQFVEISVFGVLYTMEFNRILHRHIHIQK